MRTSETLAWRLLVLRSWLVFIGVMCITFGAGILVALLEYFARNNRCPFCAGGYAIFRRGGDVRKGGYLCCLSCWFAIGRRIRATRDDPPARKLRIEK